MKLILLIANFKREVSMNKKKHIVFIIISVIIAVASVWILAVGVGTVAHMIKIDPKPLDSFWTKGKIMVLLIAFSILFALSIFASVYSCLQLKEMERANKTENNATKTKIIVICGIVLLAALAFCVCYVFGFLILPKIK